MLKRRQGKLIALGLMLVLVLSLAGCGTKTEGVVAIVDGKEISIEDFEKDFNVYKKIYEQQLGSDALDQEIAEGMTVRGFLKQEVLNKMIMEEIIRKDAEERGIEYSEEEIKAEKDEYIQGFGGEEEFNNYLEVNDLVEEDFEKSLIISNILMNKHRLSVMDEIEINEEEAKEYFEEHKDELIKIRASHILVGSEEEANDIISKLDAGESFEELALEESKHADSALNGGDLGYFTKNHWGQALEGFEEAAFKMEIGETSKPVETELGYHIIRLEDKKDNFDLLLEDIELELKEAAYFGIIEEIREKADVKIIEENLEKVDIQEDREEKKDKESSETEESDEPEESQETEDSGDDN